MLHVARFLSTPFELYALNPILLFSSVQTFFQEHFQFDKVSESNPMLQFGFFFFRQTEIRNTINQSCTKPDARVCVVPHPSPRRSAKSGISPSTPARVWGAFATAARELANALPQEMPIMRDHLFFQARKADLRITGGASLDRAAARSLMN